MAPPRLFLLLGVYAAGLLIACLAVNGQVSVDRGAEARGERILSTWRKGERSQRVVAPATGALPTLKCGEGCTLAVDQLVDRAPLPSGHPLALTFSLVPGKDGLAVRFGERWAYATPDDLVSWGASQGHTRFGRANIKFGMAGIAKAVDRLAAELGTSPEALVDEGEFQRIVVRPANGDRRRAYPREAVEVSHASVLHALTHAGHYLARNLTRDGRLNYLVDVVSGRRKRGGGYPRLGGASFFLAEVAAYTQDAALSAAAVRAAAGIRDLATGKCGEHDCVGTRSRVVLGGSAVTLAAYAELVRTGIDPGFLEPARRLAAFIRSQQRPDGEFMHVYDRKAGKAIDEQHQYYSGESAVALGRAYLVTRDPRDLEAAQRAVDYMTRERWQFFGSRYFFGNEHWTCQALQELWRYGPKPEALDFCLRYNAFSRFIQHPNGGYNLNPVHPARSSETGSRTEAASATLHVAAAAKSPAEATLAAQTKAGVGYLIANQFTPGPTHLMKHPERVRGGLPGDLVDFWVRVDFVQHAGAGMLRYLRYLDLKAKG